MRSLLLVPMDDLRAVDAASASGADALVLDLTGSGRDAAARERERRSARDVLRTVQLATERPHLYLRLEGLDDEAFDLDLATLMGGEPDGILLGGSRSGADVQQLGAKLAVHEADSGLTDGETGIIAEAGGRALSLFALGSYAVTSTRLVGLTWHAERLAADLGADHDPEAALAEPGPLHTARHLTLLAARAAEVAAIDSPSASRDPANILAECRSARRYGFNAKLATSAAEVEIIHAVFGFDAD